jgi:hypothetical protein
MVVWLFFLGGAFTILILFRQKRIESEALEIPSAMVMLFHPTKGEGDLTLCGAVILYSFSRVVMELFEIVRSVF